MKKQISPRDWELLSEYMDRQLSPGKSARLEARLQETPELRSALEELQRTRTLLRNAPRLKAPRNFTLKPSMVPQRPPRRIYPMFQMASAIASIMLVLVLVGDFLGLGLPRLASSSPYERPMLAAGDTVERQVVEEQRQRAAMPESYASEAPVEPESTASDAAQDEMEPEVLALGTPEGAPPAAAMEAPAADATPPAAKDIAGEAAEAEQSLAAPQAQAFAEEPGEGEPLPAPEPDQAPELLQSRGLSGLSTWRILEISLAVVALATGLAAFYMRRSGG